MSTYSYAGVQSWGQSSRAPREGATRKIQGGNASQHSESGTLSKRRDLKERLRPRYTCSVSRSPEPRRGRSESPRERDPKRKMIFKRLEKGVFHRLRDKERSVSAHSIDSRRRAYHGSRIDTESCYQSSRSREKNLLLRNIITKEHPQEKQKRCQIVYEETYPFTPRIRYFDFPKTRMPGHIKTYDGSEDPEDHLKIFQTAAKTERWQCQRGAICLIPRSLETQEYEESTEEFVRRYKLECRDVKGTPKCMKISRFMHGITNPELIKRLPDKIPKSVDEMMRVTTAFLRGEVAASNHERKKSFPSWKQQEARKKQNFKKGGF
ncbi:hypothetical protein Tco_1071180 [Tanacetum coccineum]|uniref:Reverse transcriptase domain-containing protein n=1 Tax=Tanacetum coccineum TaxID=301880 RepID=A0ABQ5HNJ4_9ASTR